MTLPSGRRQGRDEAHIEAFVRGPSPFEALYRHWERHQWSPLAIDYSVDAASFERLDRQGREALLWVFSHFFFGERNVAFLLAPFLGAAPDYDVQLLIATQVADEHRHLQSILRVYSEVFGLNAEIDAVEAAARRHLDPVASALFDALEEVVRELDRSRDEDSFLRAVVAYHLLTEGSVARANQRLAGGRFAELGSFPGLTEAQRLAVRDEVRHIGIGVAYVRRRLGRDGQRAQVIVDELVDRFYDLGEGLLANSASVLAEHLPDAYGVDPHMLWAEVMRELDQRLRSLGLASRSRRAASAASSASTSSSTL